MSDQRVVEVGARGTIAGYYAISPAQNLVRLPVLAPLKEGWRLATADDVAKYKAAEAARAAAEAPSHAPPADNEHAPPPPEIERTPTKVIAKK